MRRVVGQKYFDFRTSTTNIARPHNLPYCVHIGLWVPDGIAAVCAGSPGDPFPERHIGAASTLASTRRCAFGRDVAYTAQMSVCCECSESKPKAAFSSTQLKRQAGARRCMSCCRAAQIAAPAMPAISTSSGKKCQRQTPASSPTLGAALSSREQQVWRDIARASEATETGQTETGQKGRGMVYGPIERRAVGSIVCFGNACGPRALP